MVWCGVAWHGVVWCGVVWCGVAWHGVAWCGIAWCYEEGRIILLELAVGPDIQTEYMGAISINSFVRYPSF